MRGRSKTWDSWDENPLRRKDIRQDHGGGPEELPHKKKAVPRSKKFPKHKHDWELLRVYDFFWNNHETWHVKCSICGKSDWWEE